MQDFRALGSLINNFKIFTEGPLRCVVILAIVILAVAIKVGVILEKNNFGVGHFLAIAGYL